MGSKDDHVIHGGGGDRAPLPIGGGLIRTSDELVRMVNAIVGKGWRAWKLPEKVDKHWREPVLVENEWILGDRALFFNLQMYVMSIITTTFPTHFKTLAVFESQKSKVPRGVAVLKRPLSVDEIMGSLVNAGLFNAHKEGHA